MKLYNDNIGAVCGIV